MSVKIVLTFIQLIIAAIFTGTIAKDVFYKFEATAGCAAPDGVEVCFVLRINGQLPGPTIEGNNSIQTLALQRSRHIFRSPECCIGFPTNVLHSST